MCWLLPGSFDCFCCPHTSVHRPSIAPPPAPVPAGLACIRSLTAARRCWAVLDAWGPFITGRCLSSCPKSHAFQLHWLHWAAVYARACAFLQDPPAAGGGGGGQGGAGCGFQSLRQASAKAKRQHHAQQEDEKRPGNRGRCRGQDWPHRRRGGGQCGPIISERGGGGGATGAEWCSRTPPRHGRHATQRPAFARSATARRRPHRLRGAAAAHRPPARPCSAGAGHPLCDIWSGPSAGQPSPPPKTRHTPIEHRGPVWLHFEEPAGAPVGVAPQPHGLGRDPLLCRGVQGPDQPHEAGPDDVGRGQGLGLGGLELIRPRGGGALRGGSSGGPVRG